MKHLILAVAVLSGGSAFAHGHGFGGGGGYRGGGYHAAHPVYGGGGWGGGYRAPARTFVQPRIYVAPPVVYAPRSYPPVYQRRVYVAPVAPLYSVGAVLTALPAGAVMQLINGFTYATVNGTWFFWDGTRGAWVVVNGPY
jgi:hypothetical protein